MDMTEKTVYSFWRHYSLRGLSKQGKEALEVYDDDETLYVEKLSASMLLGSSDAAKLHEAGLDEAKRICALCHSRGIRLLFPGDEKYPRSFLLLDKPPEVLFVRGSLSGIGRSCTVVGARNADDYSFALTRKLSAELAAKGITIISGFAAGIDRAAHLGALDVSGKTVAVLGSGLLYDYPRGTAGLKETIAQNGAVISEFLPEETPTRKSFLIRNRLSAALGDCVLCTQAAKRSGSLNTVGLAAGMSKPVFVTPPHDLFSGAYDGIVGLLRDGAVQICSADELIERCCGEEEV